MSFNLSNKVNNLTNYVYSVIPSSGVGVFNNLTATVASIPTLSSTTISSGSITSGVYNGIQTSTISPSGTAVEVGLGGLNIGILLSTPDASRFTVGQTVLIAGNSNAVFNNTFTITTISLPNILNTNNPYAIPQLTVGSGGTVSAGTITTRDLTATNLNGKINVVGATNNSGNLILCNNTTNTTGNYDLLTDSNQHLKFTATGNILTVGGATNGSIVVPSTNGSITVPTISNGANDLTIGTSSSFYTTVYSTNINGAYYPVAPFGSQSGSFCWNGNAFGGEFSFMNNFGSSSVGGFTFNDRTGASTKRLLAKITETNFDIGVNASLALGNGNINASPSGNTVSIYASNSGSVNLISRSGGNIGFYTNNGGGSGGNFNAMNITSFASGGVQAGYMDIHHANGVASGSAFFQCVYDGLVIGAILQSGTTAISIYYGSDYRLKSNIKPIDTSLLYRLKPCSFTWTQDNRDDIGFIAHEFQEVFPDNVINQKDEVDENGKPKIQMMCNTVCIPLLVACVKEHQQQIVKQQNEITDLKAQLQEQQKQIDDLKLLVNQLLNK